MNKNTNRHLAILVLGLLTSHAHAEYWTTDEQVKNFNEVSARIDRGELQAAAAELEHIRQNIDNSDVRLGQHQRELASAYLSQGRQQLAAGSTDAAAATLRQGKPHLTAADPTLKAQYQASLDAATAQQRQATAEAEAQAARAHQEAERTKQQAEAKAAAERQARAKQQAAAQAKAAQTAQAKPAPQPPRAQLINPQASSSSVPLPMLDTNDRDALRKLLDQVAADVVAFDCAVRLEVREAKDYPFVAALLSARIKKIDPNFPAQLSPAYKPNQEPRLVLSPQSNG